ncbi:MAG: helix-turn-helix domain-containing protein [Clostridiales bacterium]
METEQYITLKELTELAQTPYATIKRDIDGGMLPAYKVGRKYFIAASAGEAYAKRKQIAGQVDGYCIKEIMEILPLSYAFVIELIKSGRLLAVKSGRRYIVPKTEFARFLRDSALPFTHK